MPVSLNDHHCKKVGEKNTTLDWMENFLFSKNSPVTSTFPTSNMMFREKKHFCCQRGWQDMKSYQALTKLTSSWQVTGVYFPLRWLTVLIFQHMAAVHQSQQQMAIIHLSPLKAAPVAPSCPCLDKQSSLLPLHVHVLEWWFPYITHMRQMMLL